MPEREAIPTPWAVPEQASRGVILVTEDEARVRKVTMRERRRLGYDVFAAEDAPAARNLLEAEGQIERLPSDVGMPRDMDGFQLAEWTRTDVPQVKIRLLCGHTKREGAEDGSDHFQMLRKPCALDVLSRAPSPAMDEPGQGVSSRNVRDVSELSLIHI